MASSALLVALGTLLSEDLACLAAGVLVMRGDLELGVAMAAAGIGILAGDLLLYAAGRWAGSPALACVVRRRWISSRTIERGGAWLRERGPALVFTSRFVPGTRLPTYLAAGALRQPFWRFALACALAVALWAPALVWLAASSSGSAARLAGWWRAHPLVPVAFALATWGVVRLGVSALTWRGRRLLLSRWRRLVRWEFWPAWVFYLPVVAWIAWLALRHRSLALVASVNPGIPGGGIAGESKYGILRGLAGDRVAPTRFVPHAGEPHTRLEAVRRAHADLGGAFPVVLKPDVGERGSGVAVVRDAAQLEDYVRRASDDLLVQRYVPGIEVGVFYYRLPGEPKGSILAVTDKRFPEVTGDGRRSLQDLILADDRAVCNAPFLLARHAAQLDRVPAAGERVPLVELGTHCRGATFLDGAGLATPALEEAIDALSATFDGFWFGRYDIRAPSYEALASGRDFTVIELNGATAEATAIYDPGNGLLAAYRLLFRQWAILFEIARRHRERGVPTARLADLWALLRRHRAAVAAHVNA